MNYPYIFSMSNKHVNHQHGLHTMNETRPKSKVSKKINKAKAKVRKAPLLAAMMEARYGKRTETVKRPRISKKIQAANKVAKKAKAATRKTAPKKSTRTAKKVAKTE